MINDKINLLHDHPECTLTLYVHDNDDTRRPTVVVCPGGGYSCVCRDREGEPIAQYYYANGFNACVLEYTVAPAKLGHLPAIEVGLAIKYMREHAEELGVDTSKVFTCGFSAGGHLAASAGIIWDRPEVLESIGDVPRGISRPDGMILCYPVITSGKYAHRGSIANLLSNRDYTEEEGKIFSLECHVKPETPPMFIWHTYSDGGVPVKNSTLLMDAYIDNGVPFEAHIFPNGPHGMALANGETWNGAQSMYDLHVAHWIELSVEWIKKF